MEGYGRAHLHERRRDEDTHQHVLDAPRKAKIRRRLHATHHAKQEDQVRRKGDELQRQTPDQHALADVLLAALPVAGAGDAAAGALRQERGDVRGDEDAPEPARVQAEEALSWAGREEEEEEVLELPVEGRADEDRGQDDVGAADGVEADGGGVLDGVAAGGVADGGEEGRDEERDGVAVPLAEGVPVAAWVD